MTTIKPNEQYMCTADLMVVTEDFYRVPVYKKCELRSGCIYRVDGNGLLETHEGLAKISDGVAKFLKLYRTNDDINHWKEVRERAAIEAVSSIIANSEEMNSIRKNKDTYFRVQQVIAERAVSYANALVKELIKTEAEWIKEL